jgi:hypothetical protein
MMMEFAVLRSLLERLATASGHQCGNVLIGGRDGDSEPKPEAHTCPDADREGTPKGEVIQCLSFGCAQRAKSMSGQAVPC